MLAGVNLAASQRSCERYKFWTNTVNTLYSKFSFLGDLCILDVVWSRVNLISMIILEFGIVVNIFVYCISLIPNYILFSYFENYSLI